MEFEINGQKFRSAKLNAIEQFHVFRKLAPVLGAAGAMIGALKPGGLGATSIDTLMPLVHAIAELPEADCDAVLSKCLSVVQRGVETSAGTAWANIWSVEAKRMMSDDINDAVTMIQIAVHVIQDNIGNFSNALPSGSTGSATQGLRSSR